MKINLLTKSSLYTGLIGSKQVLNMLSPIERKNHKHVCFYFFKCLQTSNFPKQDKYGQNGDW